MVRRNYWLRGSRSFLRMRIAGELSADAIRASVVAFGWDNVASAIIDEYATLLRQHRGTGSAGAS